MTGNQGSRGGPAPGGSTLTPAGHRLRNGAIPTPASNVPVFASYLDYLKSIEEEWPEYKGLIDYFHLRSSIHHASIMTAEIDGDDLSSCTTFEVPWRDDVALDSIYHASKSDSTTIRTQIIYAISHEGESVQKFVDAIGLLYDVDPAFFTALPLSMFLQDGRKPHPHPCP